METKIIEPICLNPKVDGKQPSMGDRIYSADGASVSIATGWYPCVAEPIICAMRGRNPDNPSDRTRGIPLEQRLEIGGGVSNTLTSVQKDNLVAEPAQCDYRIRKLTPRECFRLMDFDDEDFDRAKAAGVSDSQLYKQAGNSIVVAVLEAIFTQML